MEEIGNVLAITGAILIAVNLVVGTVIRAELSNRLKKYKLLTAPPKHLEGEDDIWGNPTAHYNHEGIRLIERYEQTASILGILGGIGLAGVFLGIVLIKWPLIVERFSTLS